jgi:hypothetical protein
VLRDYQVNISDKACEVLKSHGLVYLAMEVRTGKTLTAYKAADLYGAKKVLFISTIKAIGSEKTPGSILKDYQALKPSFLLYAINYESVHLIKEEGFDLVIIDEAHKISAFPKPSERAKIIKKVCDGLPIIFLSGTPTPESFSQLYHQFWISSFSPFANWPSFYKWANDGFVKIKQRRFAHGLVNDYTSANKGKIDDLSAHLFISWSQQQAGFTQMVQEEVLKVKMKESTYFLASKLRARRVYVSTKSGKTVVADTEVSLMQKLHQIYSGTVITDDGEAMCFDDSKALFIKEKFAGKKIAIFYKFRAELVMIQWVFRNQITDNPEEFNKNHDLTFVCQIQSGREGINLSTADALIFYNIDFSHVSYLQARARLQTLERERACKLYWIFSECGIEEKIFDRVKDKKDYQLSYFKQDFLIQKKAA